MGFKMKCLNCGTEQDGNIVHSGVDAFLLGVLDKVGKVCYDCARQETWGIVNAK